MSALRTDTICGLDVELDDCRYIVSSVGRSGVLLLVVLKAEFVLFLVNKHPVGCEAQLA